MTRPPRGAPAMLPRCCFLLAGVLSEVREMCLIQTYQKGYKAKNKSRLFGALAVCYSQQGHLLDFASPFLAWPAPVTGLTERVWEQSGCLVGCGVASGRHTGFVAAQHE